MYIYTYTSTLICHATNHHDCLFRPCFDEVKDANSTIKNYSRSTKSIKKITEEVHASMEL